MVIISFIYDFFDFFYKIWNYLYYSITYRIHCFIYTFENGFLAQEMEYKLLQQFTKNKANTSILLSGNTEILTQDVRKTKYFKELFNEQRNKDTRRV